VAKLANGLVVSSWDGLNRGDTVKVFGVRGSFTFYSARLDTEGTCLWVTVVGGTYQHSKYRHFYPTLITKTKGKKRDATKAP